MLEKRGGDLKVKGLVLTLFLIGLNFAELTIPEDQPICNLYDIIKLLGTVAGVLVASYGGFQLASSQELAERSSAKSLVAGVIIGLMVIWLAPVVVKALVGADGVCGW